LTRLNLATLIFGVLFGWVFCAAGLNQYDTIHRMLLLQNLDPYPILASAVATAMPLLWLLERTGWRTPLGGPLQLSRSRTERKHVLGGVVFGLGWAITGACPASATSMVATGGLLGVITLAGVVVGIAARDEVVRSSVEIEGGPPPLLAAVVRKGVSNPKGGTAHGERTPTADRQQIDGS
jgi:uncharacterized protein